MQYLLRAIFYNMDNFLQSLHKHIMEKRITEETLIQSKLSPNRAMTMSEIITIVIFFYVSRQWQRAPYLDIELLSTITKNMYQFTYGSIFRIWSATTDL